MKSIGVVFIGSMIAVASADDCSSLNVESQCEIFKNPPTCRNLYFNDETKTSVCLMGEVGCKDTAELRVLCEDARNINESKNSNTKYEVNLVEVKAHKDEERYIEVNKHECDVASKLVKGEKYIYEMINLIGSGQSGYVYDVHACNSNLYFAMKMIKVSSLNSEYENGLLMNSTIGFPKMIENFKDEEVKKEENIL